MRSGSIGTRRPVALLLALSMLVVLASCDALAEPEGTAPLRYRDAVFTGVTVTSAIPYGSAVTRAGVTQTLLADVYQPTGDTETARPLVIWIHGGSFTSGNRTSPEIVDEANTFAKKGYVNASISYRLSATGCGVPNAECVEAIYDAIEDAQAAVRFFRANAATYGINPNRIAVAGTSAGAITALNVGYRTTVPGNSGTPGVSSDVRAAVSLSGAVIFTNMVGPGDAPALLFHGTSDPLVPYDWAQRTQTAAANAKLPLYLVTWEGAGHVPYVANRTQILTLTTNFLYNTMGLGL